MSGDVTPYISKITSEHQSAPNFLAAVTAAAQPFADVIEELQEVLTSFDLDTAVGAQLDVLGQWIGISRFLTVPLTGVYFSWGTAGVGWNQGVWKRVTDPSTQLTVLDDGSYRVLLKFKVAANSWDGTIPGAYAIFANLQPISGVTILIQDLGGMQMIFALFGTVTSAVLKALFSEGELLLKPAGVQVTLMEQSDVTRPYFGWGIEPAGTVFVTNLLRNNQTVGAVAGTPGTMPTDWTSQVIAGPANGLAQTITLGTENGSPTLDVRFHGTTSAASSTNVWMDTATGCPALTGQTLTLSAFLELRAGSMSGVTGLFLQQFETDAGGTGLVGDTGPNLSGLISDAAQRFSFTATMGNVSTQHSRPIVTFSYSNGAVIDFTLRIFLPQLENNTVDGTTGASEFVVPTIGTAVLGVGSVPAGSKIGGWGTGAWATVDGVV